MESVDTLEATLGLVFELLDEPELRDGPSAGVVIQAYLRESPRAARAGARLGAATAREPADGRAPREGRLLGPRGGGRAPARLDAAGVRGQARVRPQLRGTHPAAARGRGRTCGPRSPRTTCARWRTRSPAARELGREDRDVEFQVLRGLGDDLAAALADLGQRVRIYCPVGDMVAGMAYLVRRLLENTANESFLGEQQRGTPARGAAGRAVSFRNEPILELRRAPARESLLEALQRARRQAAAAGAGARRRRSAAPPRASTRPIPGRRIGWWPGPAARPRRTPAAAVEAAERGFRDWSARLGGRAGRRSCARAAAILRERRLELAALQVRECAKPWPEADGDVCEAIDFLEYYALEALELDAGRELVQVPGERNTMRYAPRGVAAVIAPVELPAGDSLRHDRRGARGRERGGAEARRAVARERRRARRGAPRGRRAARGALAPARLRRGRRGAGARPARARDRLHGLERRRSRDPARRGRDARGAGPREARGVRDGRQELRDRGRGRRPRRGGAGARVLGLRLRGPEVLRGGAGARARGDRRHAARAAGGRGRACSTWARPSASPPRCRR